MAILAAELLVLLADPALGAAVDAVLIAAAISYRSAHRSRKANALVLLALVPLVRLLSLTLPFERVNRAFWYGILSTPVLAAVALTSGLMASTFPSALAVGERHKQALIALGGAPVGLAIWALVRPLSGPVGLDWWGVVAGAVIVVASVLVLDALAFGGAIRHHERTLLGPLAPAWLMALGAVSARGLVSLGYAAAVGLATCVLCVVSARTGSLAGALGNQVVIVIVVAVLCFTL
jgi:hypothetical protein